MNGLSEISNFEIRGLHSSCNNTVGNCFPRLYFSKRKILNLSEFNRRVTRIQTLRMRSRIARNHHCSKRRALGDSIAFAFPN